MIVGRPPSDPRKTRMIVSTPLLTQQNTYDREPVHLEWFFCFSWSLMVSILRSQAAPPTLKNLDFASTGARLFKKQDLGSKDAL